MKKGISLVALVITIIVLIILTGAVILTSADTLDKANVAKFRSDISSIQESVILKISENRIEMAVATENNPTDIKSILYGLVETDETTGLPTATPETLTVDGAEVKVYPMIEAAKTELKISGDVQLSQFGVDENGKVYYYRGIVLYPDSEAKNTYVTADLYTTTNLPDAIDVTKY